MLRTYSNNPNRNGSMAGTNKIVDFNDSLSQERRDVVSRFTIELLDRVARKTGNNKIIINSTIRSPHAQAQAMYTNLVNGKNIIYRPPGKQVVAVYHACKTQGLSRDATISRMVAKIEELSKMGQRVSLHCVATSVYARLNVIDISYRDGSAVNHTDFIIELSNEPAVQQIIHPFSDIVGLPRTRIDTGEQAIHVEIEVGN